MTARMSEKNKAQPAIKKSSKRSVAARLPELLDRALSRTDDFIVTCETDPDTGTKTLHVISGRFVTPCMLRKLIGQAESRRDEGAILVSGRWK